MKSFILSEAKRSRRIFACACEINKHDPSTALGMAMEVAQ